MVKDLKKDLKKELRRLDAAFERWGKFGNLAFRIIVFWSNLRVMRVCADWRVRDPVLLAFVPDDRQLRRVLALLFFNLKGQALVDLFAVGDGVSVNKAEKRLLQILVRDAVKRRSVRQIFRFYPKIDEYYYWGDVGRRTPEKAYSLIARGHFHTRLQNDLHAALGEERSAFDKVEVSGDTFDMAFFINKEEYGNAMKAVSFFFDDLPEDAFYYEVEA